MLVLAFALAPVPGASQAAAQGVVRPQLDIDAPAAVRPLLERHLDLSSSGTPDEAERVRLLRDLRKQAADLLATEGYFSPAIDAAFGDGAGLRLTVDPGLRATVRSVQLEFRGDIAQAGEARAARVAALRAAWPLAEGQAFRQALWAEAKQATLQNLLAEDYAAARIDDSRAEVDPASGAVALHVVYDSGPAFTLGEVEVEGLDSYPRTLVERYSKLEPGARYSQDKLLELQRDLQNTPYFASVAVDVDADPEHPLAVPIRVRVAEARAKRLSFGAGYSTNYGPRGEVTWRDANILDRGWQLSSGFRIDRLGHLAFADIHLPPGGGDYRDSFGVLAETNDNQGLKSTRHGVGAVRARVKGKIETRLSLNFERERRSVDAGETSQLNALVLNYAWTQRDVDNPLDPRDGLVLHAQLGGATRLLLSDQNFLRGVLRVQKYWPVFERDMLTVRAEVGWVAARSRDGVPSDFLFRAGGAQSVRGYAYQSLGVREGTATVGGRYMTTASVEYVRWFTGEWGGAVFADAGSATDNPGDLRHLARGYGLGARWRSPAGPLALDLAYGQRERKVRPVLSIAIAF